MVYTSLYKHFQIALAYMRLSMAKDNKMGVSVTHWPASSLTPGDTGLVQQFQ